MRPLLGLVLIVVLVVFLYFGLTALQQGHIGEGLVYVGIAFVCGGLGGPFAAIRFRSFTIVGGAGVALIVVGAILWTMVP